MNAPKVNRQGKVIIEFIEDDGYLILYPSGKIAEAQSRAGEDMEIVARKLAAACAEVMREGQDGDIFAEFKRFVNEYDDMRQGE